MNKSILMTQHKELYGGFYVRNNGRWFWKANQDSEEIGPISGFWLMQKIREARNKPMKTIEFAKLPEESVKVEEQKTEVKIEEPKVEKIKKPSSPKKPTQKKPVDDGLTEPTQGTEKN